MIKLYEMPSLKSIDAITTCQSIDKLFIERTGLESLPRSLHHLTHLEFLRISHNNELTNIEGIALMPRLKRLSIYECNALQTIPPSLSSNDSLQHIGLEFMKSLRSAPGLAGMHQLSHLRLRALNQEFKLPKNLNTSKNITQIIIETHLDDISMIHKLPKLKYFRIMYSLSKIPKSFYTNTNLETIEIYQSFISDLSGLTKFHRLETLRIKHNDRLKKIPDLEQFQHLQIVDIRNNNKLVIKKKYPYKTNWQLQ